MYIYIAVMLLAGGQGVFQPTQNLGAQLTLFQPGRADYAHHITAYPHEFENLSTTLHGLLNVLS